MHYRVPQTSHFLYRLGRTCSVTAPCNDSPCNVYIRSFRETLPKDKMTDPVRVKSQRRVNFALEAVVLDSADESQLITCVAFSRGPLCILVALFTQSSYVDVRCRNVFTSFTLNTWPVSPGTGVTWLHLGTADCSDSNCTFSSFFLFCVSS